MNNIKITNNEDLAKIAETSGEILINRLTYAWQEDLWLRQKWNFSDSKELHMKEVCFVINDEQIELLQPLMEEEPKCKVTFGQGNLETLSLVLKFKLTDMKVTGTMRSYSSSKPCKSFPYELLLRDVEFEIVAGLIIRGDSFCVENYYYDIFNFNIILSYKTKDESKEIFPLDKMQDLTLRKSIEKYITDKLTKDIIIAVQDRVNEDCVDTSVSGLLNNEYSYRNKLRMHNKNVTIAFQNLIYQMVTKVNKQLEEQNLCNISLPNLSGKVLNKGNERGTFRATDGSLKNLASLQQVGDITVQKDGNDIILYAFLYFSELDIVYKHLSINRKDLEETRTFETPENSNSSILKIRIQKTNDENIHLTLLDYKVDDIGYIEIIWDEQESDPLKRPIEPEVALWLNYTLEYKIIPIIEERIKKCLEPILKEKSLISLALNSEHLEDSYDSDPMNEEDEEINEEEQVKDSCEEDDIKDTCQNNVNN